MGGGAQARVSPFADGYDGAALLQRAGFALPVSDVDRVTVRYPDLFALFRDLRAMGETNVLAGTMSIVGPRPHAIGSQAGEKLFWEVDDKYWNRHSLKPGVTGLAQVRGHRGATEEEKHLTDRLGADLEYIANWSLSGDAMIVLKTIGVVIHPRAY